jgi:hypothetical protein
LISGLSLAFTSLVILKTATGKPENEMSLFLIVPALMLLSLAVAVVLAKWILLGILNTAQGRTIGQEPHNKSDLW